jgi:tetratricopeptide (TPR) repeat protein
MTIYTYFQKNQTLVGQPTDNYLSVAGFKSFVEQILEVKVGKNWKNAKRDFPQSAVDKFSQKFILPRQIFEYGYVQESDDFIKDEIEIFRKGQVEEWNNFLLRDDTYKIYEEALSLFNMENFKDALQKFAKLPYKSDKVKYQIAICHFRLEDFETAKDIFLEISEDGKDESIKKLSREILEHILLDLR